MLDINQIKARSSSRFSLGKALFESGKVSRLQTKDGVITAKVRGQQSYDVLLQEGEPIVNSCTCPAADHQDFCKHCVAVALAALEPESSQQGAEEKLKAWLQLKSSSELSDIIMDLLEKDEAAYEKWQLRFKADTTTFSFGELKKLVTKALPKRDLWEWDKVSHYFHKAESQLESIYLAMASLDEEQKWKLLQHILKRLNDVLERIDDSGGARYASEHALYQQLYEQFARLPWSDQKKANWLVALLEDDDYMLSPKVSNYPKSTTLEAEFLKQCELTLTERSRDPDYNPWRLSALATPLLNKAKADNNLSAQIRLLAIVAHRVDDYLQICQLCLEHSQELDAEDWLIRAKKLVQTEAESRSCQAMEVEVFLALGEKDSAWQTLWQLFVSHPTFHNYLKLEQLEQKTGVMDEDYQAVAEELLLQRYDAPSRIGGKLHFDDILDYYLHHGKLNKALLWSQDHKASPGKLETLASQLLPSQPTEALALLQRVLTATISQGHNEAYREACNLLLKVHAQTGSTPAFKDLLKALISQFKAKRNMMGLLKDNFAELL